jgi:hypothetical protein
VAGFDQWSRAAEHVGKPTGCVIQLKTHSLLSSQRLWVVKVEWLAAAVGKPTSITGVICPTVERYAAASEF